MGPLVSIIIPVYNTVGYLKDCIDSIINQTFCDFELLLIDDGSSDGSGQLCDEYVSLDDRVRVIHQKNSGASAARNRGIENASGDWIMFVDSDDWLELDALEQACTKIDDNIDMVALSFFYEKPKQFLLEKKGEILFPMEKYRQDFMGKSRLNNTFCFPTEMNCDLRLTSQCAKLYRKSIIIENNVRFPVGIKDNEDGFFNFQFVAYATNILFYNYPIYHFHIRSDSASRILDGKVGAVVMSLEYFEYMINKFNVKDELKRYQLIDAIIKTSIIITTYAMLCHSKQKRFFSCLNEYKQILKHPIISDAIKNTPVFYLNGTIYKKVLLFLRKDLYSVVFILYYTYYFLKKITRGGKLWIINLKKALK